MSALLKIETFSKKYDVSIANVYVQKAEGKIAPSVFTMHNKGCMFINEDYFLRREEFKKKVWLESHDMYYFLTLHSRDADLVRWLCKIDDTVEFHTWQMFISRNLFMPSYSSILSCRVEGLAWKFYRFARWLIRAIFIKSGVRLENRDIKVLLDK